MEATLGGLKNPTVDQNRQARTLPGGRKGFFKFSDFDAPRGGFLDVPRFDLELDDFFRSQINDPNSPFGGGLQRAKSEFRARAAAQQKALLRAVGIGAEGLSERLASQGILRAGDFEKELVQQVVGPATAQSAQIEADAALGFEKLQLGAAQFLTEADLRAAGIRAQIIGSRLSAFASIRGAELGFEADRLSAEAAKDAALFGAIGNIVGVGASFIPGL